MLAEVLHISMGKRKAPAAGRLLLIIYSVSFLSSTKKRETLFVCVLINTGIFRQAVSKGLFCVGTSISDIGTDLFPEVVCFKKQILWRNMPKIIIL